MRRARLATEDPLTGGSYSQLRLGELLGVSDAIISRWENGRGAPGRDYLNALVALLPTLGMPEALRALGYHLPDTAGLLTDERELLAEYRALPAPDQRVLAHRLIRALHPNPQARSQLRSRRRSEP